MLGKFLRKKGYLLLGLVISLLLFVAGAFYVWTSDTEPEIQSFEECIVEGYPILESYPRQCRDGDGNLHIEEIMYPIDPEV